MVIEINAKYIEEVQLDTPNTLRIVVKQRHGNGEDTIILKSSTQGVRELFADIARVANNV